MGLRTWINSRQRLQSEPELRHALERLAPVIATIDLVIDAGAYTGEWTREFSGLFPAEACWLMIEPQSALHPLLAKQVRSVGRTAQVSDALLYHTAGESLAFHTVQNTRYLTGSSIYRENHRETQAEPKTTSTLDELVRSYAWGGKTAFLKMDIQGAELDCLRGATHTLRHTQAILLEANFLDYNIGSPLFDDVHAYLNSKGFRLFDIAAVNRLEDGRLNQADLLYLPTDSPAFQIMGNAVTA